MPVIEKDAQVEFLLFVAEFKGREIGPSVVSHGGRAAAIRRSIGPLLLGSLDEIAYGACAANRAAANEDSGESIMRLTVQDRIQRQQRTRKHRPIDAQNLRLGEIWVGARENILTNLQRSAELFAAQPARRRLTDNEYKKNGRVGRIVARLLENHQSR